MATAHLIHGFVGAGKTTFAKKLQNEIKAVRFTPDEWMITLHGDNPPAEHFADYEQKITDLIWSIAEQILNAGTSVILDFGFWRRTSRDEARSRLKALGVEVKLYNLQCDDAKLVQRVLKRTEDMPEGALYIDAEAIEIFRRRFESLAADEECIVIDTTGG